MLQGNRISENIIPLIEPVKPSSTLLKTLKTFVEKNREIAVVFNPMTSDFGKEIEDMRRNDSKIANELYDLLTQDDKIIKSYIMNQHIASKIKNQDEKNKYLIINLDRDYLDNFLEIYENALPQYTLILDCAPWPLL